MIDEKIKKQIFKMLGDDGIHYSCKELLSHDALYNIVFGERASGKTFNILGFALCYHILTKRKIALIRRYEADFVKKLASNTFENFEVLDKISEWTKGKWQGVEYKAGAWYLCTYDTDKKTGKIKIIMDKEPFALAFPLTQSVRFKYNETPEIDIVIFDEFITRSLYLNDEFLLFTEVLSTILRDKRENALIFMMGNTVNKYCPYFSEMGLSHIKDMKQGQIDIYRYGDSELTVAVEYTGHKESKETDKFFAFDNPRLKMITQGSWEIPMFPHLPAKYAPKNILFTYFIKFGGQVAECKIIRIDDDYFTFIHPKTTEIKDESRQLIYSDEFSSKPNYRRKITQPTRLKESKIYDFFKQDKVFYSDNEIGDMIRNYLNFCNS